MSEDYPAELSVEEDKLDSMLPMYNAEVDNEGYIRDIETGEILETEDGVALTIDAIGYVKIDDGDITPVSDNFGKIVSSLSNREFRETA